MGTGMPRALAPRGGTALGQGAPCILSLWQQEMGQGKNGEKEEKSERTRHIPQQAGPSSPAPELLPWDTALEQHPIKLLYKKPISLLKAGHLATLMKSGLVSGSALSTLFYFCPRARFLYYKQDFQS